MCGILAILGTSTANVDELRKKVVRISKKLRHRGPDWSGICVQTLKTDNGTTTLNILSHERLAIVDPGTGAQPLYNESGTIALTVNGEIYNHKDIRKKLIPKHTFATESDCEVIVHLYEEHGDDFVNQLSGDFAFVIADKEKGTYLAARDPIGVCPLYIGWGRDGSIWFASEMKALSEECERFEEFPPGHIWSSKTSGYQRWYNAEWMSERIPNTPIDYKVLASALDRAVVKRLMTDVPYGVLLSGGLDSSIIASIVARHAKMRVEEEEKSPAWWPRLHSFTIGLKGAPDLKAAKEVADFLGTVHHEFHFTIEDGLDAIHDVIYHIETYDVTSIRASTPMYLLSRKIKAMGVKMVLSGEGSDEVFGGYLYFHNAPDKAAFHQECIRRVKNLHLADCLRANKSTSAWGVEARVPFLDKDFLNTAMNIDPQDKLIDREAGRIEKYILRKAFDTTDEPETQPYLPEKILWRQKEQFSDGVGYGWIDALKDNAELHVTDEMMKNPKKEWGNDIPDTKEAYWYRCMFDEHFPSYCADTVMRWTPTWSNQTDPSGR